MPRSLSRQPYQTSSAHPKWLEAIPLIKILSINEFLQLMSSMLGPIYLATGRPRYTMALQGFNAIVTLPLLILGALWAGLLEPHMRR